MSRDVSHVRQRPKSLSCCWPFKSPVRAVRILGAVAAIKVVANDL